MFIFHFKCCGWKLRKPLLWNLYKWPELFSFNYTQKFGEEWVGARFSVLGDTLGWVVEKADWISRYFVCVCSIKLRSDGCIFCIKIVWRLFNSHSPYIFRFKKRLRFCCYCGTSLNDELRHNGKSNLFAFWIINFFALGAGYIKCEKFVTVLVRRLFFFIVRFSRIAGKGF